MLLVRTPRPHVQESLFGYMLRLAETNGYEDPHYIVLAAQIPRGQDWKPGCPVDGLEKILGGHGMELRRIAYRDSDAAPYQFKILSHLIGGALRGVLRLGAPAFCVQCARDTGRIDAYWDIAAAVACPIHRCLATTDCHSCAEPLSWRRRGLLTCRCGAAFVAADPVSLDDAVVELLQFIKARLEGAADPTTQSRHGFPVRELALMPFASMVQLLAQLGALKLERDSDVPDMESIQAAAHVLSDWPNGFHRFLKDAGLRHMDVPRSGRGFRRHFAWFFDPMFRRRPEENQCRAWLRAEFVRFGMRVWGNAVVDRRMRTEDECVGARFVSKMEYSEIHRLTKPVLDRMIEEGVIATKPIQTQDGTVDLVIDIEASRPPVDILATISAREAGRRLGLPVGVIKELRSRGVIHTKPRRGRASAWHVDDVDEFLARAEKVVVTEPGGAPAVSIAKLMQKKLHSAAAKADVVQAVLEGTIALMGRQGENIGALLVSEEQATSFIAGKRFEVGRGTYTLPEAGRMTGLDLPAIPAAVEMGLLESIRVGAWNRIPAESVERFNAENEPLATLSGRLATSVPRLLRICERHGIPIISIPRAEKLSAQPVIKKNLLGKLKELHESDRGAVQTLRV